jgi:SAM-dependent methyltransferase
LARFYPPAYFDLLDRADATEPVNRLAIRYYYGVESLGRSRLARALFSLLSSRILSGLMTPWGRNRLLDVGCGTGATIDTYRRLGWTVCGIDSSPDAVAAARARDLPVHFGDIFDARFDRLRRRVAQPFHRARREPIAALQRATSCVAGAITHAQCA